MDFVIVGLDPTIFMLKIIRFSVKRRNDNFTKLEIKAIY